MDGGLGRSRVLASSATAETERIDGLPFATSRGTFSLSSASSATFTAAFVLEPATVAALGLGASAMIRRRKRA